MSKCKNCGKHGLFLKVNIFTGLCSECQKSLEEQQKPSIEPSAPVERYIEIPTVYIGNCLKSRLTEKYEDVELQRPNNKIDFSKIDCCDNVSFFVENDIVFAKVWSQTIGFVDKKYIKNEIQKSLDEKRPIFSQILGYDDETGEIHIVIAFYRIVHYDYDAYEEDNDKGLEFEDCIGYY